MIWLAIVLAALGLIGYIVARVLTGGALRSINKKRDELTKQLEDRSEKNDGKVTVSGGLFGSRERKVTLKEALTIMENQQERQREPHLFVRKVANIAGASVLGLCMLITFSASVVIIEPGQVGVEVLFGVAKDEPLTEGWNWINPFSTVKRMNIRTRTYVMSASSNEGQVKGDDSTKVLSKDGLRLSLGVTVPYRLEARDAPFIYRYFGEKYEKHLIRPAVRAAIYDAAAKSDAADALAKDRDVMADRILEAAQYKIRQIIENRLKTKVARVGFVFERPMIRRIVPPKKLRENIEEKLAAQQREQKMDFMLAIETKEASRLRIKAQGIKDFQDTVSAGISERLLQWKGIEATEKLAQSPNAKIVIVGGKDGMPLIFNAGAGK